MTLTNLKYQGMKLSYLNISHELNYDCKMTLNSMRRPRLLGQNVRNIDRMTLNDILLHYPYIHLLSLRSTNFAQLVQADIFMLSAMKNNPLINWIQNIMQHMVKCRDNNMPFSYIILITRIIHLFNVDLSVETCVHLGGHTFFSEKNITQIEYLSSE